MAKADDDSGSDHEEGEGHPGHSQEQHFRAGTVTRVHRDGTFLVEYASGQAEKHVPLGRLYQAGSAAHVLTSSSMSGSTAADDAGINSGASRSANGGVGGQAMPSGMKKPMLTRMGRWVGKAAGLIQRSERSRSRSKSQDKYAPSGGGPAGGAGGVGGGHGRNEDNGDSNGGGMLLTAAGLKQHTATAASLHRISVTSPAVTNGGGNVRGAQAPPALADVSMNSSNQPLTPAPPETLRRRPKAGRAAFKGAATIAGAAEGSAGSGATTAAVVGASSGGGVGGDPSSLTRAEIEAEYVRGCALLEVSSDAAAAAEAFEAASAAGHFQATTKLGLLFACGHAGDESE